MFHPAPLASFHLTKGLAVLPTDTSIEVLKRLVRKSQ